MATDFQVFQENIDKIVIEIWNLANMLLWRNYFRNSKWRIFSKMAATKIYPICRFFHESMVKMAVDSWKLAYMLFVCHIITGKWHPCVKFKMYTHISRWLDNSQNEYPVVENLTWQNAIKPLLNGHLLWDSLKRWLHTYSMDDNFFSTVINISTIYTMHICRGTRVYPWANWEIQG